MSCAYYKLYTQSHPLRVKRLQNSLGVNDLLRFLTSQGQEKLCNIKQYQDNEIEF